MKFDALLYDDVHESFFHVAKKILRKNASQDDEKRTEREISLLNQYNELILLTQAVNETNDKVLISTVTKRTLEARDKLDECNEYLIEKVIIPDDINTLISFENQKRKELTSEENPSERYSLEEWIKKQFELHTDKNPIVIKPIKAESSQTEDTLVASNFSQTENTPLTSVFSQTDTTIAMDKIQFSNLMAANIRKNYAGDPLALPPFLRSIDYLNDMADTADLKNQLKKFILMKLEGYAAEIVPENVASIEALVECLKNKIKPENSKIVEGRMLALRIDRSGLQNFAKQVEDLSDAFRRALVTDGMPHNLAEKQVIDKTIELCRSNAKNETVKAVLAATKFENPKEVVAKFIVESNTTRQEAQINAYRNFQNVNRQNGNQRGRNNNRGANRVHGRNNRNSGYNNNGNQNFQNNNRNQNSRNNYRNQNFRNNNGQSNYQNNNNGNNQSRTNNYRGGNRSRNVRAAENLTAPQSTMGTAAEE